MEEPRGREGGRDRERQRQAPETRELLTGQRERDVDGDDGERDERQPASETRDEDERERDRESDRNDHVRRQRDDEARDFGSHLVAVGIAENRLRDVRA